MRTIIVLTSSFIFTFSAQAQIEKGSLFLGGFFMANSNKFETQTSQHSKNTSLGARFELGKAVAENRIGGLFLSYSYNSSKNTNGASTSTVFNPLIGAGVFMRNYYQIANKWYLFGQGELEAGRSNVEYKLDGIVNQKKTGWGFSAGITPGITFAARKGLFIESSLSRLLAASYSLGRNRNYNPVGVVTSENSEHNFSLSGNLSGFNNIIIGLRWIIPPSRKS